MPEICCHHLAGQRSGIEGFSLDLSEVESPVFLHKTDDGVKLLLDKAGIVGDYGYRNDGTGFVVVMTDL